MWPISGGQLYNHAKGSGAEDWAGSKGLGAGAAHEDRTGGWGPGRGGGAVFDCPSFQHDLTLKACMPIHTSVQHLLQSLKSYY